MNLKNRIPKDFYKLFSTKYMDYYMAFLTCVYEESSRSFSTLGLTEHECRSVINEKLVSMKLDWSEEHIDEDGVLLQQSNMAQVCLAKFRQWGWMISDYDEVLNCNVLSFPEYSQLYIELFQKLLSEDDSKERESILAIYSYLYTYSTDEDKNPDILKSAWKTSKRLGQLLANMQEGMRTYFDELSRQQEFRGIQEVLVQEINNADSKKYAILTTTDSFYRYKEAVKELTSQMLSENEVRKSEYEQKKESLIHTLYDFEKKMQLEFKDSEPVALKSIEDGTTQENFLKQKRELLVSKTKIDRAITHCDEAIDMICQIEREFDVIEKRYNKLIEQKTIFASRAAARIRYILQEGMSESDRIVELVNLIGKSDRREDILAEMEQRMQVSSAYRVFTENSFYNWREGTQAEFTPVIPTGQAEEEEQTDMEDFVLRPLYTKQELRAFMRKNRKDGAFTTTADTVSSIEDLEKLFLVWQEMTEYAGEEESRGAGPGADGIRLGAELTTTDGFTYTALTIEEEHHG